MLHRSRSKSTEKPSGRDGVVAAILSAAVPLIAERGVRDVTFRDIAHSACIQHSLITRYFGSKTALLERVADHLGETLFRSASRSGDDFADIWERILREQRLPLRAKAIPPRRGAATGSGTKDRLARRAGGASASTRAAH